MTKASAFAAIALAAILISACGGSGQIRSKAMVVHLDGHGTGDYVRETSATGIGFLVPTGVLASQGSASFDIASPPPDNPSVIQVGPKFNVASQAQMQRAAKTWFMGPAITGTTPERGHVELLVTGDPGRRIYLSYEESCGFFHIVLDINGRKIHPGGPKAVSARKGANGQRMLRSPAVMMIPRLTSTPENTCYVSGMVVTRGHNDLHISLIDY